MTKKVVGSANGIAARGTGVDGSSGEFAVEGTGLQELPAGAAGHSGEEITSAEATGPPALTLDDVTSQPSEVDPSPAAAAEGGSLPRQAAPSSSKVKLPACTMDDSRQLMLMSCNGIHKNYRYSGCAERIAS